jgi:hypothetical protein
MLRARNNIRPARYCRVTYLALAGGLPSGAQNKPNARWFGCGSNRALTQCMVRRNYRGLSFGRQRVGMSQTCQERKSPIPGFFIL